MTLAMSCDDDSESKPQSTTSWLEAKKAQKARLAGRATDQDKLSKELELYVHEPNEAEDCNPFEWWSINQSRFPSVAEVARSVLGIPATSVASERLFSKCGLIISDRRSSLSPQHVEQLVFLSQNLP